MPFFDYPKMLALWGGVISELSGKGVPCTRIVRLSTAWKRLQRQRSKFGMNWEACRARQTARISTETFTVDPDQTCRLLARVLVQVAPGFLQPVGVTMKNIRQAAI